MERIVAIDPETELRFQPVGDGQSYKSYLSISNVSNGNLAYKVKTTAPRFYVVKPNQGILDRGQKINIDITLIQQPTYQLTTFWEKLEKSASQSFKLKVSLANSAVQSPPTFGNSLNNAPNFGGNQSEIRQGQNFYSESPTPSFNQGHSEIRNQPQNDLKSSGLSQQPVTISRESVASQRPSNMGSQLPVKHEYEKAPDDEINQSSASVSQSQNINQDNIKRKTEEVKRQLDHVLSEKSKIQQQINELKLSTIENEKEQYDWQQPDNKGEFRFQLIHLLIAAIICLFIGGFLGSRDSYCKLCNQHQTIDDFSTLRVNQKLLAAVSQPSVLIKAAVLSPSHLSEESKSATIPQSNQQQTPQNKPIYSFQQQHHSNSNGGSSGQESGAQAKPNIFLSFNKSPTSTTMHSSAAKKSGSTNNAMVNLQSELYEPSVTEQNNMSVIQEEQERNFRTESFASSDMRSQVTPIIAIKPNKNTSFTQDSQPMRDGNLTQAKNLCKIHLNKSIEFFCQQCQKSVCSKCMYLHHNGHSLTQIDDALKTLKQKIDKFDSQISETIKDNDETRKILENNKREIDQMRNQQQKIIEDKFKELINKIEERKVQISREFIHRYEHALFKVHDKERMCQENLQEMQKAKEFYAEMAEKLRDDGFINQEGTEEQIQMLERVPEIDKFINENGLKLKSFSVTQKSTKLEYKDMENLTLKPQELTLQNALNFIQTIHFDQTSDMQSTIAQILKKNSFKEHSIIPKPHPKDKQSESLERHSKPQVAQSKTKITELNVSFNYPKMPPGFTQTQQITDNQQAKPLSLNLLQLGKQSRSQQNSMDSNPISMDDSQSQLLTQIQVQKEALNTQQPAYGSKFAKLKFQRTQTQQSQELCLSLEPEKVIIEAPKVILPILDNYEESKGSDQEDADEQATQKIKLTDQAIYCIGDSRFILMFDHKNSLWQKVFFDKLESDYQGTLKFSSICQINSKRREFLYTGGCNKITKEASSQAFKFSIPTMRVFKEIQSMKEARYGHASVYINQLVLVLGGFNHRDDEAQAPNTLSCCEKYSIKENQWTSIAPMHQERAYFSACRVKEEFIYVFGGFLNYETTNSIEFYNIMLDKWTLLSITLPIKIAKYGLAKIEENQIVIAGGLLVDSTSTTRSSTETANYSCVNTVYKFDCNTLKWTKLAKLNFRRNMYSVMPVKENQQIYAIGGTVDGINEVYDMRKKKWNTSQSYTSIMGQNDLQTYALCSLSKFNDD